jgi:hypothetical protein
LRETVHLTASWARVNFAACGATSRSSGARWNGTQYRTRSA